MTINYPERFAKSQPAGFDGVFDWDFLKPAFAPTKIEPMDLDAIVERNGRFLVFETKSQEKPIPQGQVITLEQLAKTRLFTIIILRCKTQADIRGWECWFCKSNRVVKRWCDGDANELMLFVKRWFDKANATP